MRPSEIVFFDLETGGFDPNTHAIVQIAAIAVDAKSFVHLETFERKILFPKSAATEEALKINSYDPEVWEREAINPDLAVVELTEFLKSHATRQCVSAKGSSYTTAEGCAHNGAGFDGPFLKAWYARRNQFMPMWPVVLDTHQFALWVYRWRDDAPEDFKLGTLAKHLGIQAEGDLHDALTDVRVTIEVCRKLKAISEGSKE